MSHRRLWWAFSAVVGFSFAVLIFYGTEIYRLAPPIPERVVTTDGKTVFTGDDIRTGQNVWQSMGGQEIGSIWGHGSYVAPDWTADWLHREALFTLDAFATDSGGGNFQSLAPENQASLERRLQTNIRKNTYDPATQTLTISPLRAQAIEELSRHYSGLFQSDPALEKLRGAYAIPANALKDPGEAKTLSAFFFWTAWAAVTERPASQVSYTNNWPPDALVGNTPTGSLLLWTGFSVIILLGGIGLLAYYYAVQHHGPPETGELPKKDPLLALNPTPSMRATLKYFWVVAALIVVQMLLGAVTAHYGVEGAGFYGFPLADYLPYAVTRTWHLQLGIFWIATAWLATGLFIAPAVSGYEPPLQKAGVNFLFIALLVIVVGSLAGEWASVMRKMDLSTSFWFGHQGYEYVDLGRFWQTFLLVGLFLWLGLMMRSLWPALKKPGEQKHLLILFSIASAAIAFFYAAGLMYGRHTNLAVAEYWRWWVVHLWVEGFFEVFATVVIAFLFVRMGLINVRSATSSVLFATVIFLFGGILGTFHHLYFTGTPTAVLALGASFSALECVPLILIGFEGYSNLKLSRSTAWLKAYKWPIYCFIAVAFWNFLGAGIFGFLINPPIALYYMQGLNTTPVHGHTALFGVYGMLAIGLMLFALKGLAAHRAWKDKVIALAFWCINIGMLLQVLLSVLPVGLAQAMASMNEGLWYARSAEFMQDPGLQKLRWMRVIGDTIFSVGAVALGWFVVGLKTGHSVERDEDLGANRYPSSSPSGPPPRPGMG